MDQTDPNYFLLTFDVEDWFQVENFKAYIPFSSWSSLELRVERNVHRILDLLDEVSTPHASGLMPYPKNNSQVASREAQGGSSLHSNALTPLRPQATFFVLGWIAEHLPHLVREIGDRGHEVASHGYNHQLCYQCSDNELKDDLIKSKKILEGLVGKPVIGYRAPSFSINYDVISVLQKCGYQYDSSYNSFGGNSRYGKLNLDHNGFTGVAYLIKDNFYELPISNLTFGGRVFPLGGGGYFRLIPFPLFTRAVQSILKKEKAYLFYLHPWECDFSQPKVERASRLSRFRHYHNLAKTELRLAKLIMTFKESHFVTCRHYIQKLKTGIAQEGKK